MELQHILKIGLRWWWLIALPVVVVALYVGLTYTPPGGSYQVVMRFAAGTEPAGLSEDYDRYYPWLTSEYVANGLADVAVTGAFAEAVSARLAAQGLEIAPGALQASIVSDNAQSIAVLYITWADPEPLLAIAEAATAELTTNGAAYFPQLEGVGIAARRLDAPAPVALAPGLRAQLMGPALRLALAGAVGLALAFLAHTFDPTLRESAELAALGIPIVGRVPFKRRS